MQEGIGREGDFRCHKDVSTFVATSHDRHVTCPQCKSRKCWRLSDGRRKCSQCGRKFTPRPATGRLEGRVLREIARGFWLLVPARRLAQDLGLAERTVERRYRQLRRGIAQCRAELLVAEEPLSGDVEVDESYFGGVRKGKRGRGAAGKIPVFGLLKRGGTVRVALPERLTGEVLRGLIRQHVQPQSWVYTDGFSAYDQLDLEGFRHVRVDHSTTLSQGRNHINGIENFWAQAKRWLRPYSGGFKRNFALFILEAEFRFNHRNDPKAVDLLLRLLRSGRVGK